MQTAAKIMRRGQCGLPSFPQGKWWRRMRWRAYPLGLGAVFVSVDADRAVHIGESKRTMSSCPQSRLTLDLLATLIHLQMNYRFSL